MDIFSFIKDCLLTYNYPLAHSMNEEEIADVFKTSNRCFLISWMLKLLDGTYEEVLENFENDKEFLGNIVYELGFCAQKEKLLFMTGGLPVTQQVKIISNIFTYITDIKKCNGDQNVANVSNDDLAALLNTDLNLFPMYGEIKLLKPADRALKMSELRKETIDMKICEQPSETKTEERLVNEFNEDIQDFIEKLKIEFPKIKSAMEMVSRNNSSEADNVVELNPDLVDTLRECCRNLKIISQYVKDINTIENFEQYDFGLKGQSKRNSSTYDMVKVLHKEVLTVLKYSRCL